MVFTTKVHSGMINFLFVLMKHPRKHAIFIPKLENNLVDISEPFVEVGSLVYTFTFHRKVHKLFIKIDDVYITSLVNLVLKGKALVCSLFGTKYCSIIHLS